ncbi:HIG1 domain-containing protein C25B8.07c, mitochondrial [Schizosaccharomyces pombe]|uniref:HIG1 domain-containing protein C25B8.07c, mitochondrial n=1 Tax=Schizosaccharomyces pombe (strain 972 / ATCC 24843) TaxID=284812 RepID=YL87_SCHPO|nr:uncharacterized protein SPAC25B8.07c [Schizosaccharomyces pombe]Q9UTB1.1 RecName: Full=HIG1 domain-containing protein C25B8.07c, mitochondrial [Schizosaccharomyces pombe 972h-]CAB61773.1 hypoxia induced family protein [Schizosaccharomyces pombe]|eukprot:NP_594467.1 uncharacterized protein SPAC25B8.07c [Schizosaccharomyces pombe]
MSSKLPKKSEENLELPTFPASEESLSRSEKLKYVFVRNPFIPLGCLMTVGTFLASGYYIRRENHLMANKFMRYRVMSQGFTLAALAFSVLFIGPPRREAPSNSSGSINSEIKK